MIGTPSLRSTIMFDDLFGIPAVIKKYQTAPLAEPRSRYLRHLKGLGACPVVLRKSANDQLSLIRLLDLQEGDRVSIPRIEAAAAIWSRPKRRRCIRAASPKARKRFVSRGIQWLRFLGWLDKPGNDRHPHHAEVRIFERWLRTERGLSGATVQSYCVAADRFLSWLSGNNVPLNSVPMTDIDDAIAAEPREGAWNRRPIHDYARRPGAVFLFAEARGGGSPGLAAGISAPPFMTHDTLPQA